MLYGCNNQSSSTFVTTHLCIVYEGHTIIPSCVICYSGYIRGIQEQPDIENFEVDPSSDQYVGSENIDNDEESSMLHIRIHICSYCIYSYQYDIKF